ncbi:hypothetical protein HU200_028257 [Digitaria exilis]|uniref:Uncharacterized protein n=1 Tax=Digitaria exilis TaxID=1010633 RepID=A0A835EST3_9POAL|nr:hypothetical protein HU200_028257 [Digitaria exilis]
MQGEGVVLEEGCPYHMKKNQPPPPPTSSGGGAGPSHFSAAPPNPPAIGLTALSSGCSRYIAAVALIAG